MTGQFSIVDFTSDVSEQMRHELSDAFSKAQIPSTFYDAVVGKKGSDHPVRRAFMEMLIQVEHSEPGMCRENAAITNGLRILDDAQGPSNLMRRYELSKRLFTLVQL